MTVIRPHFPPKDVSSFRPSLNKFSAHHTYVFSLKINGLWNYFNLVVYLAVNEKSSKSTAHKNVISSHVAMNSFSFFVILII